MTVSRASYFWFATLSSILWVSLWIYSQPAVLFSVKDMLGLAEDLSADPQSFYMRRVDPIMDAYCISCHGPDKAKDDLRLDEYQYLYIGGEEGSVTEGVDRDSNLLLARLLLPSDDIKIMPPLGRARPTAKEMAVLSLWLAGGASHRATAEAFPGAPAPVQEVEFPELDFNQIQESRGPYASTIEKLEQSHPSTVSYVAQNSAHLRISGVTLGSKFDDQTLTAFESVFPLVSSINLSFTSVSDKSIDKIVQMPNLREAYIDSTEITADALERIIAMPALKKLVVDTSQTNHAIGVAAEASDIRLFVR